MSPRNTNRKPYKRPVNLNFFTIQFPITAVVSLLHRMSGILILFFIPALLWFLEASLASNQQWDSIGVVLDNFWIKSLFYIVIVGFIYHFIAGIRHLLMDMGIGDTKLGARIGAICTVWMTIVLGLIALGFM